MESLNKLMAGSETDGGNARLEVSGAGKTEDGLVQYNEEVNKLGDDLRELYGNVGEMLGRIMDGTLFKNADKVSVVARSTDGAGVLAKHADEAGAWLHGVKVFRYSDETAEAVASGEKLLKESGTIYESFADMMSPEDAKRYLDFLENGSREGLTGAELAGVEKADALLVSQEVEYDDVWDLRNAGDLLESGRYSLPQGISQEQFSNASKRLRDRGGDISGDIVVQGSRAKGTAKPTSDIDIALRVSGDKFDSLINQYFKTPNPGSAKERTMLHAIETGKIQAGEAKLSGLRKELQEIFGMEVDISIIKQGGAFDNPPFIPFE